MLFTFLDRFRDTGLLVLRLGLGVMFMLHGYPKLTGGPELWEKIGSAIGNLGITFAPAAWGLAAAIAEFGGGILLLLGLLFRPACFLILCVMVVAATMHIKNGDAFSVSSHAIEIAIVMASLLLIGPGPYSADAHLTKQGVV